MWALCIECQLGQNVEKLRPDLLEPEVREQIGSSIEQSLLMCFPLTEAPDERVVHAFDTTIVPTAQAWAALGNSGSSHPLAALLESYQRITDPDQLSGAFRSILSEHEGGRLLLCQNTRIMAYTGNLPNDQVWEFLRDEQWRRDVWLVLDPAAMEVLFDAFSKVQAQLGDKWTTYLPHFYATTCEASSTDRERQELLFAYTVASSVQTGTVSALERLLSGQHQDQFSQYVDIWRERLLTLMQLAPAWVAARMRATLASLYVAE